MAGLAQHAVTEMLANRAWFELVDAVRLSPSPELAAALQDSLGEEHDRAARKEIEKLLFLLLRAGCEPVEERVQESHETFQKAIRPTIAIFSCSDPSGANLVLVAKPKDFVYSTLTASVHPVHGVLHAACSSVSDAHLPVLTRNFNQRLAGSLETAEANESVVLWKLKQAVEAGKRAPTAIAFWRSVLEAATEWADYPRVEPVEMGSR